MNDYPPSQGWTLHTAFSCAVGLFSTTATLVEASYESMITATTTAAYAAGTYAWVEYVTGGDGERHTLATGECVVLPDIAAAEAGADRRSQAQRGLDAVNALLEGRAADGVSEYEIHGRSIKKMSVSELLALKQHLQSVVNQERAARGESTRPRRVLLGFGACR